MNPRGVAAEQAAEALLRQAGLRLLFRNWRGRRGELDLVMEEGATVVVVEVRARGQSGFGDALESIGPHKRQRLLAATRELLAREPRLAERPLRFDVVTLDGDHPPQWLREAFEAEA
ncbi:MAG TPA: YraN family protein [Nevskiaceae bacterium]|nr:YraN family protein [Nevskiaceae bacterium]